MHRRRTAVFTALALAAACGGTKSTSGATSAGTSTPGMTSGGEVTTGGSTSGGTGGSGTGAATTGASSSGGTGTGGVLAAGKPCSFDSACASGICGIDGSGKCCLGPKRCPLGEGSDVACDPSGCDDQGACVFPGTTTTCGSTSCADGIFTSAGYCNGAGLCDAGSPFFCLGFNCNDAGVCDTTCTDSHQCTTPFKCNGGRCAPPRSAGSCTENDDCNSGTCAPFDGGDGGDAGFGNCCLMTCEAASNPICDSTGCDPKTGACLYPEGLVCGVESCAVSKSVVYSCDPSGDCLPIAKECPNDFACNGAHTACNTSCMTDPDCASGFFCDAGVCGS